MFGEVILGRSDRRIGKMVLLGSFWSQVAKRWLYLEAWVSSCLKMVLLDIFGSQFDQRRLYLAVSVSSRPKSGQFAEIRLFWTVFSLKWVSQPVLSVKLPLDGSVGQFGVPSGGNMVLLDRFGIQWPKDGSFRQPWSQFYHS